MIDIAPEFHPLFILSCKEKNDDDIMVSLSDIRGAFNIKKVDVATTVLFDTFFSDYIKVQKELRKKYKKEEEELRRKLALEGKIISTNFSKTKSKNITKNQ